MLLSVNLWPRDGVGGVDWFYEANDGRTGPVDAARLIELYRTREVRADTLV